MAMRCLRGNEMWAGLVRLDKKPRGSSIRSDFGVKCNNSWYSGIHFMHLCDYNDISGGRHKQLDDVVTALFEVIDFYLDCNE